MKLFLPESQYIMQQSLPHTEQTVHRRRRFFLKAGVASLAAICVPKVAGAKLRERRLDFYHTHTGEDLSVAYHDGLDYLVDAMNDLNHCLRDFRTGDICQMDPRLIDMLHDLKLRFPGSGSFEIISGYRSPKTNSMLSSKSGGVAKKSLHMQGRAIDIRLRGVDTAQLRDAAIELKRGGVGYYRKSDFIHVDTGRVRRW